MISPRRDIATRQQWTREQIRAARRVALAPLLHKRGLALLDRGGGNLGVEQYNGVVLKDWYWNWPERDMSGNTIDFYVEVLGTSFNDAMREILESPNPTCAASQTANGVMSLRSERGYLATKLDARSATRPSAP